MQHTPNPNERTELIEIVVSNIAANEFSLGQLPNLRNATEILRIENISVAAQAVSPSGKAVMNAAVTSHASLKLINSNNVEYRHISLSSLTKAINGTTIPLINCPKIDPEKSKIVVGSTAGLVLNEVFLLQVTYIIGPSAN